MIEPIPLLIDFEFFGWRGGIYLCVVGCCLRQVEKFLILRGCCFAFDIIKLMPAPNTA